MASEELIDVVDEDDRVLGSTTRSQMRAQNLLHRSVFILCKSTRGAIYVHRRTLTKDVFPGLYDMFVGGVVGAGETYEAAALREIGEELGIVGPPLRRLFHHRYESERSRAHIEVFDVVWDGPIVLQDNEIDWGAWVDLEALVANQASWTFVPDGAEAFARYREVTR